jgi:hypothetical protein
MLRDKLPRTVEIMNRSYYWILLCVFLLALTPVAFSQQATLSPTSLQFVYRLGSTPTETLTLTNSGVADLKVSSIVASGFYNVTSTCSDLAPGESCPIEVTFGVLPQIVPGQVTTAGQVTITDNAPTSPQVVQLTGTTISGSFLVSPSAIDFGTVAVGETSAPQSITLTNLQATAVKLGAYKPKTSANYSQKNNCPASLAAGASCTIQVVFTPTVSQVNPGIIAVGDPRFYDVALSGTGSGDVVPQLSVNPGSLNFGIGTATQSITVTNTSSTASLTIDRVSLPDPPSSPVYALQSTKGCKGVIPPGGQCSIVVEITGNYPINLGVVTIASSDSTSPAVVGLSAAFPPPTLEATFSPSSLSFSPQEVGTTSPPQTVTFTMNVAGEVLDVVASGDYALSAMTCPASGNSLTAGTQCALAVSFTPTVTGVIDGSVTFSLYPQCIGEFGRVCYFPQLLNLAGTGRP